MSTRAESAAATRQALLDAAGSLLDTGGPGAVTLRGVGTEAGVSRGAPYGHFADKDDLLAALAINRWVEMTEELVTLKSQMNLSPSDRLKSALDITLALARHRPYLYALMFKVPPHDPDKLIQAASEAQDEFLSIVGAVVGADEARKTGALLLSSAHGIAGMELSGQLMQPKWGIDGDGLLELLIGLIQK